MRLRNNSSRIECRLTAKEMLGFLMQGLIVILYQIVVFHHLQINLRLDCFSRSLTVGIQIGLHNIRNYNCNSSLSNSSLSYITKTNLINCNKISFDWWRAKECRATLDLETNLAYISLAVMASTTQIDAKCLHHHLVYFRLNQNTTKGKIEEISSQRRRVIFTRGSSSIIA